MRLTFGQELRQEQRQILTQRMIQSMEILQLTLQQLEERIGQEMSENPVLELDMSKEQQKTNSGDVAGFDSEEDNSAEMKTDSGIIDAERADFDAEFTEPEIKIDNETYSNSVDEFAIASEFEQNYSGIISDDTVRSQNYLDDINSADRDMFANIPDSYNTFQAYLEEQLGWFEITPELRDMIWRMINNLDARGYFPYELEDFLTVGETVCSANELALAKQALKFIQTKFDPKGVAAKDFRDCLLLQIDPESPNVTLLKSIISEHLEDVSANRLNNIVRWTGYSMEQIQSAVAELKRYHPRPSAGFGSEVSAMVVADVILEIDENGDFAVQIADDRLPQLRISKLYDKLISDKTTDKETKEYIRKKIGSAKWLMEAIEQRHATLLRVSKAVLKHQEDFFRIGPQAIKPLKMQQIADELGIHLTTVSRAVDEKWMATPDALYPLRRFFVTGLEMEDGTTVANDAVQLKIKEIVNGENKSKPLKDDEIVNILEADGIKIARRTVAKYRQILRIPSGSARKMR